MRAAAIRQTRACRGHTVHGTKTLIRPVYALREGHIVIDLDCARARVLAVRPCGYAAALALLISSTARGVPVRHRSQSVRQSAYRHVYGLAQARLRTPRILTTYFNEISMPPLVRDHTP